MSEGTELSMWQRSDTLDSSYECSKQQTEQFANTIVELASKYGQTRIKEAALLLIEKLRLKQFNLLVLGEFKRGKSTLINALLGQNVMPTGVLPLTSVVTIVSYGATAQLTLMRNDGKREIATIDMIGDYVTEERNPHNVKGIASVEIELPSDFLKATGVRIVDTPGIGSVHDHNTEATVSFLPNADAALFLFSADQPASRQEFDFLKLASKHAVRFFFVQNKIDHLSQSEKDASNAFLAQVLLNELGSRPALYALSAKKALVRESNNSTDDYFRLRRDLLSFLLNEKSQVFLESVQLKMSALLRSLEQVFELERKAVALPPETLATCIVEFGKCATRIEKEQDDADLIVKGEAKRLLGKIDEDLKVFAEQIKNELVETTKQAYEQNKSLHNDELISALRKALLDRIALRYAEWKEKEESMVSDLFNNITSRFVDRGNSIVQQLRETAQELFQFQLDTVFEIEPLSTKSMHRYEVHDPFTVGLANLPLLLPSPLAKRIIRDRFLEGARSEGARNAGLLRADFQERIERSTFQFLTTFRKNVRLIISDIEVVLSKASNRHREADTERKCLDDELVADAESVRSISKKLENPKP